MSGEPATLRLTRAQVREVDRLAIEEYHIPGIVLMENAARGVADAASTMLGSTTASVAIVCGSGNNGGDGFAVARHLHNRGFGVTIVDASRDTKGDALVMARIAAAMQIKRLTVQDAEDLVDARGIDFVIDALLGTGLSRAPNGTFASIIQWMNEGGLPVLAVDIPSGLDCDTGTPPGACVRANKTVTFVAEKAGFSNPASRAFTGEVVVADIGCPRELITRVTRR